MLNPAITAAEARKAIGLLERLGFIERTSESGFTLKERLVTTGDEVRALAITNFQLTAMDLAKRALVAIARPERHSATYTLGLSESGYRLAKEKLDALGRELMEIARLDAGINRVYQVNLHAFPLTKARKGTKR